MIIDAQLKDWGNSYGIRIPKSVARSIGIGRDEVISVTLAKKRVKTLDGFGIWREPGRKHTPYVREPDDENRW